MFPATPTHPRSLPRCCRRRSPRRRSRRSKRRTRDATTRRRRRGRFAAPRRRQRSRARRGRRRRTGRRQAQDAPRQPWRQEPAQEAGRSRGRARRGCGRDRGRRRGGGCRRRDRERRRPIPTRTDEAAVEIAVVEPSRPSSPSRRRDGARPPEPTARGGRAVSGRVRGSGLRADVRVARRFRPQMMAAFRYTPSACGHLPAFSAPESTLP